MRGENKEKIFAKKKKALQGAMKHNWGIPGECMVLQGAGQAPTGPAAASTGHSQLHTHICETQNRNPVRNHGRTQGLLHWVWQEHC